MKRSHRWAIGIVSGVIVFGAAGILLADRFLVEEPTPPEPAGEGIAQAAEPGVESAATPPEEKLPLSVRRVRRNQPKPDWDISPKDWAMIRAATRNLGSLPLAGRPGAQRGFKAASLAAPAVQHAPKTGSDSEPKMIASVMEALRAQRIATDATPILVVTGYRESGEDGEPSVERVRVLMPVPENALPKPPLESLRIPENRVMASEPVPFNDLSKSLTQLLARVRDQGLVLVQPDEVCFRFEDQLLPGDEELLGRLFVRVQ